MLGQELVVAQPNWSPPKMSKFGIPPPYIWECWDVLISLHIMVDSVFSKLIFIIIHYEVKENSNRKQLFFPKNANLFIFAKEPRFQLFACSVNKIASGSSFRTSLPSGWVLRDECQDESLRSQPDLQVFPVHPSQKNSWLKSIFVLD